MHPGDAFPEMAPDGIMRGIYDGAAGMLHALGRLAERGAARAGHRRRGGPPAGLHEASLASPDEAGAGASLLVGSSGILLVAHRLDTVRRERRRARRGDRGQR